MDIFSGTGIGGLQSGFVLAVILLAVFFAERSGGSGQLAQRGYQVALGLAITFLVISATTAFVRSPELPEELEEDTFGVGIAEASFQEDGQDAERLQRLSETFLYETAQNASEVGTIHSGLGILLIGAGLAALRLWRVPPFGAVIGGILLLLFGSGQGGGTGAVSFLDLLYGSAGGAASAGQVHDATRFAVLFAGTAALVALGFLRWEGSEQAGFASTAT